MSACVSAHGIHSVHICHVTAVPLLYVQVQWVKATTALANLVLASGDRGVNSLLAWEKAGMHLAPGTFRCLEGMVVPEDFLAVLDTVDVQKKPSVSVLPEAAGKALLDRWLEWAIQHPDLDDDYIHVSRSVLCTVCCLITSL